MESLWKPIEHLGKRVAVYLRGTALPENSATIAVAEHGALSRLPGWQVLDTTQKQAMKMHPAFAKIFRSGFVAEHGYSLNHNGCRVVVARGEGNRFLSAVDMLADQGYSDGRVKCYIVLGEDLVTKQSSCIVSHFRVASSYRRIVNGLRAEKAHR